MEYSKPKILIDIEEYEYLKSLDNKEEKLIEKDLFPIKARIISNKSNSTSVINYYIAQDKKIEYGIGIDSLRGEIIISIL